MTFKVIQFVRAPKKQQIQTIKSPLLQLPWEIREPIFALALEEPVRHARRHHALCKFSVRNTTVPETPPYSMDDRCCRCTRRRNTGLLLTNRQIYNEASPIFWRQTMFCFKSVFDFHDAITHDEVGMFYHDSLHHIRIDLEEEGEQYGNSNNARMWDALETCRNLRRLELNIINMTHIDKICDLPLTHPHLETVRCFWIVQSKHFYDNAYKVPGNLLFFEVECDIPRYLIPTRAERVRNYFHHNANRFRSFVERNPNLFETLRCLKMGKRVCLKDYPRLKRGFHEPYKKILHKVLEPLLTATVYGLPNSKATVEAHNKERKERIQHWLTVGFPVPDMRSLAARIRASKKMIKEKFNHQQLEFEIAMKEKGIKTGKHRPDPEPEELWKTKRREKLEKKRRTRARQAERLRKSKLLNPEDDE